MSERNAKNAKPFQRMPFAALSERPRRPHPYWRMDRSDLTLGSRHFGTMRVHVRTYGSGPPLVLVHGLMTSSYSWRYVLEPLGSHFRLIVPDLPGAGRTAKPSGVGYGAAETAEWLGELLTALDVRGAPMVANSMGGYLAMLLCLREPDAVSRLTNLHSPGIPLPRLRALRAALSIPGAAAVLSRIVRLAPQRWAHANVHYYDESLKSLEEARVYGAPLATREGAAAFAAILRDTLDPSAMTDFTAALAARRDRGEPFPVPLQLIYARQDPMVPPSVGHALADLVPGARFDWLEEASHFAHVDAPERFLVPTLDFLRS